MLTGMPVWSKVVGVTFCPGYPESILDLVEFCENTWDREPLAAVMVRDPDNPHDRNAIQVHVPAVGHQIGHLPRNLAAELAPALDAGERWLCEVTAVRVHEAHPDRPGIDVLIRRPAEEVPG